MTKPPDTNFVNVQEAFIPPEDYAQLVGLENVPDLTQFPNGIYILGTWGFSKILGYYVESQIDRMKQEEILGH